MEVAIGKLLYNPETRTLSNASGSNVAVFTETCAKVLDLFLDHTGTPVSHQKIVLLSDTRRVDGEIPQQSAANDDYKTLANLRVHKLRKALGAEAHRIVTHRGVGYTWVPNAKPKAAYGAGLSQVATVLQASDKPMSAADILRELPKLGETRIDSALSSLRRDRRLKRHGDRRSATYSLKKDSQ